MHQQTAQAERTARPEQQWRDQLRAFAAQQVRPRVAAMDAAEALDPALVAQLFDARLMAIEIPESYGGLGRGLVDVALAIEELARIDPAVAVFVDVQNALVNSAILRH